MNFTVEETNLMCIYSTGTRNNLIESLSEMQSHLQDDEAELQELTTSVLNKLNKMTDEDYVTIIHELVADFED